MVQRGSCRLFELFAAARSDGAWRAGSGAIWNLRSNKLRPRGWTSADAAGLPILPGLARQDEVARGEIPHALRFTVSRTRRAFVWPARHYASSLTDPDLPAMGQRLRLKRSVDDLALPEAGARRRDRRCSATACCSPTTARTGTSPARPDPKWDNDDLRALKRPAGQRLRGRRHLLTQGVPHSSSTSLNRSAAHPHAVGQDDDIRGESDAVPG